MRNAVFEIAGPAAVPAALLDAARADATAAGYAAGWAQGMRAARERLDAERIALQGKAERDAAEARAALAAALAALDRAAAQVEAQAAPHATEIEDALLDAAVRIAEALLARELRHVDTARDALARALALAPAGETVTVHLAPADRAVLAGTELPPGREIVLVADPALRPGDAVATTGATTIDARLAEGLARVRAVLSG